MPILIRTATSADAALLTELGSRTFRDAYADENTAKNMALYLAGSFSLEKQAEQLADPSITFLIAELEKQPVGYARLKKCQPPLCVVGEHPLEIVRFYSVNEWIGHGVGTKLMKACMLEAHERGCDVVWLEVWKENHRGISFYRRWGFKVVGSRNFQMGEKQQQVFIMVKAMGLINTCCKGEFSCKY